MFTKNFWKAVAERAIKSAAQGAVTVWGIASITDISSTVSAGEATGFGALSMGVLSVLTSIASSQVGNNGPSLTTETVTPPTPPVVAAPPTTMG